MSEPNGPTGILTLKQVSDLAYEQYNRIILRKTGVTQINISPSMYQDLFERQSMETQLVWLGEFQSRIQGAPNPNQSSFYNTSQMAWPGGAWGVRDDQITNEATLSGGVKFSTGASPLQYGYFATNESAALFNATSHVSYNPTFYMRWAQTGNPGAGQAGIGWIRRSNAFISDNTQGSINFRWDHNGTILAVCAKRNGGATDETTISTGVTGQNGVYHTGKAVVTGGGTAVEFFFDGVSIGTVTTTIPDEAGTFMLTPNFGQYSTVGVTMIVDYMALSQQRDPS